MFGVKNLRSSSGTQNVNCVLTVYVIGNKKTVFQNLYYGFLFLFYVELKTLHEDFIGKKYKIV